MRVVEAVRGMGWDGGGGWDGVCGCDLRSIECLGVGVVVTITLDEIHYLLETSALTRGKEKKVGWLGD